MMRQTTSITHDTREDWLKWRQQGHGIGASDVATILGLSPYQTPWDLWHKHHHGRDEGPVGPHLELGTNIEPHIVQAYANQFGVTCEHYDNTVWALNSHPWARCSPDAAALVDGRPAWLLEVKTARQGWAWYECPLEINNAGELNALPVPAYGIQCYWQMVIAGCPHVDLVVMPLGIDVANIAMALQGEHTDALGPLVNAMANRLVVIRIYRDTKFERGLAQRVAQWRHKHLIEGVEPDASASTFAGRWFAEAPKTGTREVGLEDELATIAVELKRLRGVKAEVTTNEREAHTRAKQLMADVKAVITPHGLLRWRKHGRGHRIEIRDDLEG